MGFFAGAAALRDAEPAPGEARGGRWEDGASSHRPDETRRPGR